MHTVEAVVLRKMRCDMDEMMRQNGRLRKLSMRPVWRKK